MSKSKAELKEELDALGVEYDKSAKNADLEALLAEFYDAKDENEEEPEDNGGVDAAMMEASCYLNVRTSPDVKANNIDHRINAGDKVVVVAQEGEWSQTDDGMFIMTEFLH